jgi:hypothetical protein
MGLLLPFVAVGNISFDTVTQDIEQIFGAVGPIKSLRCVSNIVGRGDRVKVAWFAWGHLQVLMPTLLSVLLDCVGS